MFNPIEERKRMVQERIAKSFDSGINIAEEMELEKAWNIGDEKVYQGVTYVVGGFNAKGVPLWRKKKDGGDTDKKSSANTTDAAVGKKAKKVEAEKNTTSNKDFDFKFIEAERGISDIYPKPDYVKEGYIRKISRTESKSGATEYVGVLKFNDGLKIEERLFSRTEAKKWFIDELKKKQQSITNKQ